MSLTHIPQERTRYFYKLLSVFVLLIAMMGFAQRAHATCTNTSFNMSYSQPVDASVVVASSLNVGDMIPGTLYSYVFSGSCTTGVSQQPGSQIISCYYGTGTQVLPGVYSTGLAGVGIRLRNSAGQPMQNATGRYCDTRSASLGILNSDMTFGFSVTIELVKTGPITGGLLNQNQTYFGFGVYQANGLVGTNSAATAIGATNNAIGFNGSLNVREVACNLTFPAVVQLPKVSTAALAGGAAAGVTGFTISQSCDSAVNVGLTFDAAPTTTVQSAANGTMNTLTPGLGGNASGVVLQLVDSSSAIVPLQSRIDKGYLPANTLVNYSYNMQYRGTGGTVTAGNVASAMVFTFDYN